MKVIINISFLFLIAILFSCNNPKEVSEIAAENSKLKYADGIKPLEFDADSFKEYTMIPPRKLNQDLLEERSRRVAEMAQGQNLKFVQEERKSKQSKYMGLRVSDDPSGVFEIQRVTGRMIFNRGLKNYKGDDETPGLPDEGSALDRTRDILSQLPGDIDPRELSKPSTTYLEMSLKNDQEAPQTFRKMITVRYDRIMDNLPVEGKTRLVFSYGQDAELTHMVYDWPKWESQPVSSDRIFDPRELEKRIEDKIIRTVKRGKDIIVEKRYITLYDDGAGRMEPAVYVQARYTSTDQGSDGSISVPYDFYVPILKGSSALFPHVKDRNLEISPLELKEGQRDSNPQGNNKEDE